MGSMQSKQEALAAAQQAETGKAATAAPDKGQDPIPGMDYMMHRYESELKKPIRNLVNGQLARSLLIQVGASRAVAVLLCVASKGA